MSTNSDAAAATNWLAADVNHNLVANAASYNFGANDLYSDHGSSGAAYHHNVVAGVGGISAKKKAFEIGDIFARDSHIPLHQRTPRRPPRRV